MDSRMMSTAGFFLLLCLPMALAAQEKPVAEPVEAMPRVDQADAKVAPLEYPSVFIDYIPFQPAGLVPWAEVNARVANSPGHAGHGAMSQRGHAGHAQHMMGGAQ